MATQLEFSYYRTVDKSEVDFVVEGVFGTVPVEVKLSTVIKRQALIGLQNFIADVKCPYGIVINRGKRVELLTENIVQIPVQFI